MYATDDEVAEKQLATSMDTGIKDDTDITEAADINGDINTDSNIDSDITETADNNADNNEDSNINEDVVCDDKETTETFEGSESESELYYKTIPEVASDYNGVALAADGNSYLYKDGKVDTSYNGIYTVYLIKNGVVWRDYNDFYEDKNHELIKIRNGRVDSFYQDIFNSPTYGCWLVRYGRIDYSYTGTYSSSVSGYHTVEVREGKVVGDIDDFPLVTDYRWVAPGEIVFVQPKAYKVSVDDEGYESRDKFRYAVQIEDPDGETYIYSGLGAKSWNDGDEIKLTCDSYFVKSGTYRFRIKTTMCKEEEDFEYGIVNDWKSIEYKRPDASFAAPSKLRIDDSTEQSYLKWNSVPGCKYYCVRVFYRSTLWDYTENITDTSYRLFSCKADEADPFEWKVQVWAYGDDPTQTAAGFSERIYPNGAVAENDVDTGTDDDPHGDENGLVQAEDGNWYLYDHGDIDYCYNGLYCDAQVGWWLVLNGKVAFDYTDLYFDSKYGWWKVNGGAVDFEFTDFYNSPTYGWWLVNGGKVDFEFTDFYNSPTYGWWLVNGGNVDFGYTDFYDSPTYGWWLVNGGRVDFGYTDFYDSPIYGWWLVNGGRVDFGYTDFYDSPIYGWWLVNGGRVDFGYSDIFKSSIYGNWKVADGTVDFGYTGDYDSQRYGRCYVNGGQASF